MDPNIPTPQGENNTPQTEVQTPAPSVNPNLQPNPAVTSPQPTAPIVSEVNTTDQPPAPSTPPTPQVPPEPVKKSSPVFVIALILLLIAIVMLGGYVLWTKYLNKSTKTTPTPVAVVTASPTPDPTANWKTYTNNDLGLTFKYPNNLVVSAKGGENPYIVIDTQQVAIPEPFDSRLGPIEISYDLNGDPYSKALEKRKADYQLDTLQTENINSGGVRGVILSGEVIPGFRSGRFVQAIFDNGSKPAITAWYQGYPTGATSTPITENIFDQVVSTFKFIEASPSASGSPSAAPN